MSWQYPRPASPTRARPLSSPAYLTFSFCPGPSATILNVVFYRLNVSWNKVHIYEEYHSVCPLVGIGTLPPPLSLASVPLPPEPEPGGHTRLRIRGWGSPNSDDWRKSLALCLLCFLLFRGDYLCEALEWIAWDEIYQAKPYPVFNIRQVLLQRNI